MNLFCSNTLSCVHILYERLKLKSFSHLSHFWTWIFGLLLFSPICIGEWYVVLFFRYFCTWYAIFMFLFMCLAIFLFYAWIFYDFNIFTPIIPSVWLLITVYAPSSNLKYVNLLSQNCHLNDSTVVFLGSYNFSFNSDFDIYNSSHKHDNYS